MISTPRVERRPEQPYAAIRTAVPIPFGPYLPPLWDKVRDWLTQKGVSPGPAMIRYLTTDMTKELNIEAGYALDSTLQGDDNITASVLPAGRYGILLYTGPYEGDGLIKATAALLDWAKENDLIWKTSVMDGVEWWAARLELYLTDPAKEPDPEKWQVKLAFLASDEA
jgi:effector-binding domain-containing protein